MRRKSLLKNLSTMGGLICVLLLVMQMVIPATATAATGSFEFDASSYSVDEGAGQANVLLNRVGGASGAATIQVRTLSDTTDWKTDYESFSWTTVSFADGETQKTVSVVINDDTEKESSETLNVLLRKPSDGTTLGSVISTAVTIIDNDSLPGSFEFAAAGYSVAEDGGQADVVLKRVGGTAGAATVEVRTLGVTADYATDYTSFSWTPVNFADGESQKTISIAITDDAAVEDNEAFTVLLQNPTGGTTLGAVTESTVTIVDNDEAAVPVSTEPGSFEFAAAGYSVAEDGGSVDVLLKRVGGSYGAATVEVRTMGVTADYATDYTSFSWTTVNFADGETLKPISIAITDDAAVEDNETFTVLLQNPTGGTTLGSVTESTVTIVDNDEAAVADTTAPVAAITTPSGALEITSAQTLTIVAEASDNVAVSKVEFYDGSSLIATDTTNTYSASLAVSETDNGTHNLTVVAYDAAGNKTTSSAVAVTVNIATASAEPGSFEFSAAAYSVDEDGGTVDVLLKRVGGTSGAATVEVRTLGVTADYATDYTSFSWTVVNFADGESQKTISIAITDDALAESDETFTVLMQNPTGGTTLGSVTESTVTIVDNDIDAGTTVNPDLGYLPTFPGAEGYGTETGGGRGGQIIRVTNLNDSGTGSLRAAIQASGARIVVFEVSGIIELQSELIIANPYITIAGQTAPAPGIMLKNRRLKISAHDVVIQHIRVRPGDERSYNTSEEGERDCLGIVGHSDIYNVVVDHCSFQWAVDEVIGIWGYKDSRLDNITISNCIVSEGLDNSIHPEGAHSKGFLIGDYTKKITVLRNLISSSDDRNGPNAKGGTTSVVINNYVYNAGRSGRMHYSDSYDAGTLFQSTVGNVFRDGPEYATKAPLWWADNTKVGSQVYASDNQILRLDESAASVPLMDPPAWGNPQVGTPPVPYDTLTILPTSSVKSYVLQRCGARPAERGTSNGDSLDERVVNDVWNGSGSIIDTPAQGGGWPTYARNTRQFVAPSNPNGDDDGDGYTNIEEVLQQMAAAVE